ncbi:four helix bundle protein [Mucilaginibacter koreensis]
MDKIELQNRTKKIAVDILNFVKSLPSDRSTSVLINQLVRSSTSIGANYRSACKGKSTADFNNKIIIVEEEADETIYWLELIEESASVIFPQIKSLRQEANELTAIFTEIGKTAKANANKAKQMKTASA